MGMIVSYFRSSSYNQWDMCPQSYFLTYILGIPSGTNKKAEQGTITHKVMECLAASKKALQDGKNEINDDSLGDFTFNEDYLNSDEYVQDIFMRSYRHYTERSTHPYKDVDRLKCFNTMYRALRLSNGAFDPRKREVISPELHFDFEIDEEWANYEYELPDGQILKGKLALKGTIDLITKVNDKVYESTDWKTGQRIDWGSNRPWPHNIKTFEKLQYDPQLRIYHYALHNSFPHLEQIIPTIFFIDDHGTKDKPVPGGAFTMAYAKEEIPATKEMIRKRFEVIKETSRPKLIRSWKCDRFCHFGKTAHKSGDIDPRTGKPYTICEYIAKKIRDVGMEKTIELETDAGHKIGYYQQPGA